MHVKLSDFGSGWFGLELGIKPSEIDTLIMRLQEIKTASDQHFHISSDYEGEGGLGDLEIYIQVEDQASNMFISSLAIPPDDPTPAEQGTPRNWA